MCKTQNCIKMTRKCVHSLPTQGQQQLIIRCISPSLCPLSCIDRFSFSRYIYWRIELGLSCFLARFSHFSLYCKDFIFSQVPPGNKFPSNLLWTGEGNRRGAERQIVGISPAKPAGSGTGLLDRGVRVGEVLPVREKHARKSSSQESRP